MKPELLKSIALNFLDTLLEMSPYLLFGFFIAGILSAFISQKLVERHLGGKGIWPLIKASIFGVPLPLCSCGVIPVSMSLYKHGASRGSTIAFLLSTPQTGADNVLVVFSLLGPVFAVFSPIVAFTSGIIGGTLVDLFDRNSHSDIAPPPKCTGECCGGEKRNHKILKGLKYGFITLPRDIGKPLLIGLVIAALISAFVPKDFFAESIGTGITSMFIMMLIGIPIYVCSSASVPIAAAMILKGLSPGAALVFLMTGPATNAASIATIWKMLGWKTAILYLISIAGCALMAGVTLNYILTDFFPNEAPMHHHVEMIPLAAKYLSAAVLMAVLIYAIITKKAEDAPKK